MRDLPEFALAVLTGLKNAITTDPDVFLMTFAGILLGGRRGLGKALLFFIAVRRGDQVAAAFATKLDQIVLLNRERNILATRTND